MLLELEDVHVRYGSVEALKGVSLAVGEGEIVTLIGANGAGKTTTLRTISGLRRPYVGGVTFRGERIDRVAPHRIVSMGIGHVPEGRKVFPRMSVVENLQMGAYQRRGSLTEDMDRVFSLFPVLAERRTQPGGTLSGGEQQMLAIGRALMGRPSLLLLDEPSMGLAPLFVQKIFAIVQEINAQGTTVLLIEQNAAQALKLASRGYVLETGEVVMSDEASTLLTDERVRAAYLGEGATAETAPPAPPAAPAKKATPPKK
jgi:branched-chain amino acid transport system ATP-binding protein